MSHMPGYIKVTKEMVYERYPDLDDRIVSHIEQWRDSVEVGTSVTVAEMMNFQSSGRHGMPVEIVMDHVFPEGGACSIKGVEGVSVQGPPLEVAHGMPKLIKRVS